MTEAIVGIYERIPRTYIKFCLVGLINTSVDIGILALLILVSPYFSVHELQAKTVSFLSAVLCSFVLNRYWTFERKHPIEIREIALYYLVIGSGVFINIGITKLVYDLGSVHIIAAALCAAVGTSLWGYLWAKRVIFRNE